MRIDDGVERLARRLAGSEPGIFRAASGAPPLPESAFDSLARALGAPISRRRALVVAGGVIAAGSMLRPGRASAAGECPSGGPKVCSNASGAKVCVPDDLQCCSNQYCAIACPYRWRDCGGPAICNDAPRMCRDPSAPGYDKAKTKFCSQEVRVTNGCVPGGYSTATRGWCCRKTESCSSEFGMCVCFAECGNDCCTRDQECVPFSFLRGGDKCLQKCKPGWHHDGYDCECDKGQTCGVVCCPAGQECVGNTCAAPPPAGKLPSIFDGFFGFGDTVNQTAASRGTGSHSLRAGAAAASAVDAALLALAAVNAQGAVAGLAFTGDHADGSYRRSVPAPRPSVPHLQPGPGLDPRAAAALQALLASESQGFALALASATALARARGALRHHDLTAARRQAIAASALAGRAARALRAVPSLRAATAATLRSTGASDVVVTPGAVLSLQAQVRAGGVPADLQAVLRRLGVKGDDLRRARAALLAPSAGGPALIAPLADPARTTNLRALASELGRFSQRARRTPISRSRGLPKRYRP